MMTKVLVKNLEAPFSPKRIAVARQDIPGKKRVLRGGEEFEVLVPAGKDPRLVIQALRGDS